MKRFLNPVPTLYVMVIPFVVLVAFSALLTARLSFQNSRQNIDEIATLLNQEIAGGIILHIQGLLQIPHQITQLAAQPPEYSGLNTSDPEAVINYFYSRVKIRTSISSLYFGNPAGGLAGCGREGAGGSYYVLLSDQFKKGIFKKYGMDAQGRRTAVLATVKDFDATSRVWYTRALEKGGAVWSPIYLLSTGQDMAIAASRPIFDKQNHLVGVCSVDTFLSQISHFLKTLKIGKTGIAFIIEPSGLLVATSTQDPLFMEDPSSKTKTRLNAGQIQNPIIQKAMIVRRNPPLPQKSGIPNSMTEFDLENRKFSLNESPIQDGYGLDWRLLLIMPESDVMAGIDAANRLTVFYISAILIGIIGAGFFIARRINKPVLELTSLAHSVANGDDIRPIEIQTRIKEPGDLIHSFNQMSLRLVQTMEALKKEVVESRRTQQELKESEQKYRNLIENAGEAIFIAQDGHIRFLNPKTRELLGYSEEEIKAAPFTDFIHPDDRTMVLERHVERMKGNPAPDTYEFRVVIKSGEIRWVVLKAVRIEWEGAYAILNFMRDYTSHREATEKIKSSLKEKEILLKEIHHRVKNNLQIISSLIDLQAQKTKSRQAKTVFAEARGRVKAIALAHQILYQHENLSAVDLGLYLNTLANEIRLLFSSPSFRVRIAIHAENIWISLEEAIPCGLIINELITNSLKHAFPQGGEGEISIHAESVNGQKLILTIRDNGVGMPPDIHPPGNGTLGLRLVTELVEGQLEGTWQMENKDGVCWTVSWPRTL